MRPKNAPAGDAARRALAGLPRTPLAKLPTPLDDMPRLARALGGPRLLVKRDDLTGLAGGGNKARKLEFLLADALAHDCDVLVTAGGAQSNHCRQTAAAAAQVGLGCHLVLGGAPQAPRGNLLLDGLLGAEVHWVPRERRAERLAEVADELRRGGRRPYLIPVGGSTPLGALGYALAMVELVDQLRQQCWSVDHVVVATSSGGTQAGLVLGAWLTGFAGQILAVSIDQPPDGPDGSGFRADVCRLARDAAALIGRQFPLAADELVMNYDYLGGGYGVLGPAEREAIALAARHEGLLTGPVYTARAAAALIDLVRRGAWNHDETVLFWHTGDDVALHAYADQLA